MHEAQNPHPVLTKLCKMYQSMKFEIPYPPCFPVCSCEPWQEGLILQPWAFWTSLFYLVSLWLVWKRNANVSKSWIAAVLLVTIASLTAHASFDVWSLAFDEASVVTVLFAYHWHTKSWLKSLTLNLFLILMMALIFILLPLDSWVPVVALTFVASAILAVRNRGIKMLWDKEFLTSMVIYGISFLLFAFDKHPLLCQTKWFPFGHPLWHVGSALTTFLLGDWWFREARQKSE